MYLSKLELHGFKSFAERTSMHFDPGVTAVVGPNGCGKSNIVDAVRWVIGEQRARILRSDKMESVIFNGTAKKRPLGMAEVMLTIENNRGVLPVEYDEITIGRRLFRSGESEYILNGVQCRLKDITDLFMDTGMGAGAYSVIELKMIEEILSDNAQDRRRLFEEAAGITRYKSRRAQALKKLDNTQADLTRLRDLLDEIEKRVRSLKRQASKATKYKEVSTRLRALELSLSRLEFDRLNSQKHELEREIAGLRDELEGQIARHGESEAALEAVKLALLEREESYAKAQSALRAHLEEVQRIEAEIRLRDERVERGRRDLERSQTEQAEAHNRIDELERESDALGARLRELKPEVDETLERLELAARERDRAHSEADEARRNLTEVRTAATLLSDAVAEQLRTLDRQNSRLEMLESDHAETAARRAGLEDELETAAAALKHAGETAEERAEEVESARDELEHALAVEATRIRELEQSAETLQEHQRRAEAITAEIQLLRSLVSSYEDANEAVRYLADERDWTNYELLTVADVIGCATEHRAAMEAALAGFADCVVVHSDDELERAVGKLRGAGRGRATFVVLDRLVTPSNGSVPPAEGALPLAELARPLDSRYRRLADVLLRNAFFVDDIGRTPSIRSGAGTRLFSRSGEWVDGAGVVYAGSAASSSNGSVRFGRREQLEQALEQQERIAAVIAEQQASVERAEKAVQAVDVGAARAALAERERAAVDADKVLAQARFEYDAVSRGRSELTARLATLNKAIEELRENITSVNSAVEGDLRLLATQRSDVSVAEEVFHEAESNSRVALARYSETNVAAVEVRNRFENLQKDQGRARDEQEVLRRKVEERTEHIEQVQREIAESEEGRVAMTTDLDRVKGRRAELERAVDAARDELHERRSEIAQIEQTLREIRRLKEDHQRAENQRAVKLAEVQTRVEELIRHIDEDYGVRVADVDVVADLVTDEATARREVVDLRRQVRSMGPINELALEEYEQEQERFEFMSKQLNDLNEAEKTLLATIDEINTTASNRFLETFAAIQQNFERLFSELFGTETSAELLLENPEDPLESAIEVMARPKGKRPSVLAQLSGGEKTLTAIALLFSIYLVKPSPFCILDEVDAPLDDANIARFMKIIREFAKSTQFILVTHNKRTMEAADRMYGVTMQEQGVSSLVGVKFEEVHEVAA